jgi:hypothetical protein
MSILQHRAGKWESLSLAIRKPNEYLYPPAALLNKRAFV